MENETNLKWENFSVEEKVEKLKDVVVQLSKVIDTLSDVVEELTFHRHLKDGRIVTLPSYEMKIDNLPCCHLINDGVEMKLGLK